MMRKLRLSFTLIAIASSIVAATVFFTTVGSAQAPTTQTKKAAGGHLYMQTNETRNSIIHYHRSANGALAEVERVATGGAGSGELSPIYHINRPNDFEGAGSVILTPDRRFLFATNAGDNSVSSFAVDKEGRLTLLDVKRTGNTESGGAKSLAYAPSSRTLYVVHTIGPDYLRLMSVNGEGKLTPRPEKYSVNTMDWNNRVPTMAVLSPDGKFLFVGSAFDEFPSRKNPDGSLILWIPHKDGALHVIASNAPDPDGIVVFPVGEDGALREASFYDARGASPFYIAFLHNRPDTFVVGYAVSNGVSIGKVDAKGKIAVSAPVTLDTSGNVLSVAKDPASPKVPGDGTFRGIDGVVSSGPSDSWLTPDGAYLYQIYGNASKLVGYAIKPDGSLEEVTSVAIPYNSPEGLAGF